MSRNILASIGTVVILGAIVFAPSAAFAEEDQCATLQSAPTTAKVVAGDNAGNSAVLVEPNKDAQQLGYLTPGTEYKASASFPCSDGWVSQYTAVVMPNGAKGFVSSAVISPVADTSTLVFDSWVSQARLTLGGTAVRSQPSATANSLGDMHSDTAYEATRVTVEGASSLTGSGQFKAIKYGGDIGWVDTAGITASSEHAFDSTPEPTPTHESSSSATPEPRSSGNPATAAKPGKAEPINGWPFVILGSVVAAFVALFVSRRRKTKGSKTKPVKATPEEPVDAQDD